MESIIYFLETTQGLITALGLNIGMLCIIYFLGKSSEERDAKKINPRKNEY